MDMFPVGLYREALAHNPSTLKGFVVSVTVTIKHQHISRGRIELEFHQRLHGRKAGFNVYPGSGYAPTVYDSLALEDILGRLINDEEAAIQRVRVVERTILIEFDPNTPPRKILRHVNETVRRHGETAVNFGRE